MKPDAITSDAVVEIKFTDDFTRSMYNAARKNYIVDREVDKSIEQALRYELGSPPKKLIYYTNDWGLAEYYTRAFRYVGIADFKFVIVPAIRSSVSPVGEDHKNEQ